MTFKISRRPLAHSLFATVCIVFLLGADDCEPAGTTVGDGSGPDTSVFDGSGGTTGDSDRPTTDDSATGGGGGGATSGDCAQAEHFPALDADSANAAWDDPYADVYCDSDWLVVESNGIPNYEFVPMTPNGLSEQDYVWEVPRYPVLSDQITEIPLLGLAAFAVNGLPIFGPNEGAFPDPYGDPLYNDIVDECLGHTAQQGTYHYHALLVDCVLQQAVERPDYPSPIIGYAMDGFPIYGPQGCLDGDCTEVVEFQSGYEQIDDPTTYAWDAFEYVPSSNPTVLDECNGRIGPDGTYRYHATETFPYVLACYRGDLSGVTTGAVGGGGAGQPPEGEEPPGGGGQAPPEGPPEGAGGGPLPTCIDVPEGMPCCGDGICDGPETGDNCPTDC